jgi:hypothetical protein
VRVVAWRNKNCNVRLEVHVDTRTHCVTTTIPMGVLSSPMVQVLYERVIAWLWKYTGCFGGATVGTRTRCHLIRSAQVSDPVDASAYGRATHCPRRQWVISDGGAGGVALWCGSRLMGSVALRRGPEPEPCGEGIVTPHSLRRVYESNWVESCSR